MNSINNNLQDIRLSSVHSSKSPTDNVSNIDANVNVDDKENIMKHILMSPPKIKSIKRNKIVFSSSPSQPFSEYIINSFSISSDRQRQNMRNNRYRPSSAVRGLISTNDIKVVLSGLHRINSESAEVSNLTT
jgi:hypothetical protein